MGLVLGQHHRAGGQAPSCWWSSARTWSRSGSPLATSRGRRPAATSRTRRCRSAGSWRDGPGTGTAARSSRPWGGPAADGCVRPAADCPGAGGPLGAGQPARRCPPGCSGAPAAEHARIAPTNSAMAAAVQPAGRAGSSPAAGHPVRAVHQPEQVTGVASGAGSLGVHAGGGILARASWGRCSRQAPTTHEATSSAVLPHPGVTDRTSGHTLSPRPGSPTRIPGSGLQTVDLPKDRARSAATTYGLEPLRTSESDAADPGARICQLVPQLLRSVPMVSRAHVAGRREPL